MSLISLLGRMARRLGIYERISYSRGYLVIQRLRNPEYIHQLAADEAFYRLVLCNVPIDLIFDVGANVGDKAEVFARFAKRVVCFEPDPRLAASLRRRFARRAHVVVEERGLSNSEGTLTLHAYDGGSAHNTVNPRQHDRVVGMFSEHTAIAVPMTTLDDAIKRHGIPGFLKVDVEGHEKEVFQGLGYRIPFVSFEANLPQFREETCEVARHLERLSPTVMYSVCGSGMEFDFSFPMTTDAFCAFIRREDAPPYVEAFARLRDETTIART